MDGINRIDISGKLVEIQALRFTPAGIPIIRFRIDHTSRQLEGGCDRSVACGINVVAIDREAHLVAGAQLGTEILVNGFLDRKNRNSTQIELHAAHIEFRNL